MGMQVKSTEKNYISESQFTQAPTLRLETTYNGYQPSYNDCGHGQDGYATLNREQSPVKCENRCFVGDDSASVEQLRHEQISQEVNDMRHRDLNERMLPEPRP